MCDFDSTQVILSPELEAGDSVLTFDGVLCNRIWLGLYLINWKSTVLVPQVWGKRTVVCGRALLELKMLKETRSPSVSIVLLLVADLIATHSCLAFAVPSWIRVSVDESIYLETISIPVATEWTTNHDYHNFAELHHSTPDMRNPT
ncbi:hypothetical protein HHI36_013195 [Cryptolaemus montrouzieri]|uniref:Uncharacterized protein n=1 Tax=Cryptolaemus montrouzieri TaxID=559131 RepID=A0ABD2NGX5_9CUCU